MFNYAKKILAIKKLFRGFEVKTVELQEPNSLGEHQRVFTRLVADLIIFAYSHGYELTFGETYRPLATAELYATEGIGLNNSLHTKKLAVDFNLFKDGKYLSSNNAHEFLGEFWESLSFGNVSCCWGGRFGDGNHYSISYRGKK